MCGCAPGTDVPNTGSDIPDLGTEIPAEPGAGHVYILIEEGDERCKIGKTTNIDRRMRDLGRLSSRPLRLAALLEGYTAVERWFHVQFSRQRVVLPDGSYHGEWFRLEGDLKQAVDAICAGATTAVLCPNALQRDGFDVAPVLVEEPENDALRERREAALAKLIAVRRQKGRLRLCNFVRQAFRAKYPNQELQWGPHIQAICDHIEWQLKSRWKAVAAEREARELGQQPDLRLPAQNILINAPPRSLKTFILSCATIWAWLHEPDLAIMYLGLKQVSVDSARLTRDLINSEWFKTIYAPDWTIRRDQDAITDFGTTAGGSRRAISLEADITGQGANWIIVDDPNDAKDGQDNITKTIEGYKNSVHNRVNHPSLAIRTSIMQKFPGRDFATGLLETGDWLHVRMPMSYRTKTSCRCGTCVGPNVFGWKDWRTKEGEVIHPRFTPEFLAKERIRLGPYAYDAQMDQESVDMSGATVKRKWWGFARLSGHHAGDWERPPGCYGTEAGESQEPYVIERLKAGGSGVEGWDLDWLLISIDAASKKTESGSNYGILVGAGKDARRFVLDDITQRGAFPDILEAVKDLIRKWKVDRVLIEAKAAGGPLIESLRAELETGKLKDHEGRPIVVILEALEVQGDKAARLQAVLPQIAARLVYLLDGAEWLAEFVNELSAFPNGTNDDRVDALSQFLAHMFEGGGGPLDIDPDAMLNALMGR